MVSVRTRYVWEKNNYWCYTFLYKFNYLGLIIPGIDHHEDFFWFYFSFVLLYDIWSVNIGIRMNSKKIG